MTDKDTDNLSGTIENSPIPEVVGGTLGAGIGGAGSVVALAGAGKVAGLSAAGMTSGLAAAGGFVGGGMLAGLFVFAAPIVIGTVAGVGIAAAIKAKRKRSKGVNKNETA